MVALVVLLDVQRVGVRMVRVLCKETLACQLRLDEQRVHGWTNGLAAAAGGTSAKKPPQATGRGSVLVAI